MYQLQGEAMRIAFPLFDAYTHFQSVIYSVLDGQFPGTVHTNDAKNPTWALLQTPFGHHFLAGTPNDRTSEELESLLYDTVLPSQEEQEIDVFAVSDIWQPILRSLFEKRKGVMVPRIVFDFSHTKYDAFTRKSLDKDMSITVSKRILMPISTQEQWIAEIFVDGVCISSCSGLMYGRGYVEIDIHTEEEHRGKGYATMAACALIDILREHNLIPCWATWPHREASQAIARKLGFMQQPDVPAWIWSEQS